MNIKKLNAGTKRVFAAEYEKLERAYLTDAIDVNTGVFSVVRIDMPLPQTVTVPIEAYAAAWRNDNIPSPIDLAKLADLFLQHLVRGTAADLSREMKKAEGECVKYADALPEVPKPEGDAKYILLVRHPWEISIERDFDTRDVCCILYGRYGLLPREWVTA